MKVKDICTRAVRFCSLETTLAEAGAAMWDGDCGVLPILDETGRVLGVVTDRDIAIGAATKFRPAAEIAVREVSSQSLYTCKLGDEVRDALKTIRQQGVRRLPVVDSQEKLQGLLSLNDIALATVPERSAKPGDVTYEDLALALKAVCSRPTARKEEARKESMTLSPVKPG